MELAIKPSLEIASPHTRTSSTLLDCGFTLTRAMRHPTFSHLRIAVPISHTHSQRCRYSQFIMRLFLQPFYSHYLVEPIFYGTASRKAWLYHVASYTRRYFRVVTRGAFTPPAADQLLLSRTLSRATHSRQKMHFRFASDDNMSVSLKSHAYARDTLACCGP
jgi:hypothetical protein